MAFDSSKSALTKNNFAVGFSNGDFTLHTNVNDGQVSIKLNKAKFTLSFFLDKTIYFRWKSDKSPCIFLT